MGKEFETTPEFTAQTDKGIQFLRSLLFSSGGLTAKNSDRNDTLQAFVYLAQTYRAIAIHYQDFALKKAGAPLPGSQQLSYDVLCALENPTKYGIIQKTVGKGPEGKTVLKANSPRNGRGIFVNENIVRALAQLSCEGKLVDLARFVADQCLRQDYLFSRERLETISQLNSQFENAQRDNFLGMSAQPFPR